jgi:hypothetical protein
MSQKNLIENYLENDKSFRERSNKDKGIVDLLINKYGLFYLINQRMITKDTLVDMVQDYASMDRSWRYILEHNPQLRGKDYDDKDRLEAEKMEALGYNRPHDVGPADPIEDDCQDSML